MSIYEQHTRGNTMKQTNQQIVRKIISELQTAMNAEYRSPSNANQALEDRSSSMLMVEKYLLDLVDEQ